MSDHDDLFVVVKIETFEGMRHYIKMHESSKCVTQVAYSTYHDALTCVDFTCKIVITNMKGDSNE